MEGECREFESLHPLQMALPPYQTVAEIQERTPPATITDIEDQIAVRKALMHDMVGSLYPSILLDEIYKLLEMRSALIAK